MDIRGNIAKLKVGFFGIFGKSPDKAKPETPTVEQGANAQQVTTTPRLLTAFEMSKMAEDFKNKVIEAMKNKDFAFFDSLTKEDKGLLSMNSFEKFNAKEHGITDLSGLKLNGLVFRNADFSGVDFTGSNLARTLFTKDCKLDNANFSKANLLGVNFGSASHIGLNNINFTEANLKQTEFWGELKNCVFDKANLTFAKFFVTVPSGSLSFKGANMLGANFDPGYESAISYVDFSDTDLRLARIKLGNVEQGVDFNNALVCKTSCRFSQEFYNTTTLDSFFIDDSNNEIFENVDTSQSLRGADLSNLNLTECTGLANICTTGKIRRNIRGEKTKVSGLDFTGANLSGANLFKIKFENCSFKDAFLFKANMSKASFDAVCDFQNASIDGAKLEGIDIKPSILHATTTAQKMGGERFKSWFIRASS